MKYLKIMPIILMLLLLVNAVNAIDWWDSEYSYRQNLNITTTGQTIPQNYTATIIVNTTELIGQNKLLANLTDLRIVYFNGTHNTEIDRINTTIASAATKIQFRIQQSITTNSSNYFMYYGNYEPQTTLTDKTKIYHLFEDFEDISHPFSSGSLAPTINTASEKNGVYGLEGDGLGGYRRAVVPKNLNRGYTIEGWVYSGYAGDNADLPGLGIGMQSANELNGYQIILDWRSGTGTTADFQIRKNYGSSSPVATSSATTVTADTWYYINVTWQSNGRINATLQNSALQTVASLSAIDTTYTTGYYGVVAYRDGFWDDVKVSLHLNNKPLINRLTEESLGPKITNVNIGNNIKYRNETTNITLQIPSEEGLNRSWIEITNAINTSVYELKTDNNTYYYDYVNENIGPYNAIIFANDTLGQTTNYTSITWTTYGFNTINDSTIQSQTPYIGFANLITCQITDVNTTTTVSNISVEFYSNITGILQTVQSNIAGIAEYNYFDATEGLETIGCRIFDEPNKYYNVSGTNDSSFAINTSIPPSLTIVEINLNQSLIGLGEKIKINTSLISPGTIDVVIAQVSDPNGQVINYTMQNLTDMNYEYVYDSTFQTGIYQVIIYANDSTQNSTNSEDRIQEFTVSGVSTINIEIDKQIYGANQTIVLTTAKDGWWSEDYEYRKKIVVTNNDVSDLTKNYTAVLELNTQSLVSSNKLRSDCKDLRIIYEGESIDWTNMSACNNMHTLIEFKVQNNISDNDTYYAYYGNSNPSNPPQNKANIYALYEDFEQYSVNTAPGNGWTADPENSVADWQVKLDGSNKVLQEMSTNAEYHRIYKGLNWNNYEIDAKMKLDSFLFAGITFRRQPLSGSYYDHYALISDDRAATNKLVLRIWNGGGSNFVALQADNTDFDATTWHDYKIIVFDESITIGRDSNNFTRDISLDATKYLTGGSVGLMSYSDFTMFDDIKVKLLVNNPPTITVDTEEVFTHDSNIHNEGTKILNAYLRIIVQEYTNSWNDYYEVLVPNNSTDYITINTTDSFSLSQAYEIAGSFNTTNHPDGLYRLVVRLTDFAGNIIENDNNTLMIANKEFRISATAPEINLLTPDYIGINNYTVSLNYNVSDLGSIQKCELYVNSVYVLTDNSISLGINTVEYTTTVNGPQNWQITCLDNDNNWGESLIGIVVVIPTSNYEGLTTDLSSVDTRNVQNFIIDRPGYGNINYTHEIDLSSGANINQYVKIENYSVTVRSEYINPLNNPARITFYESTIENPVVFADGVYCGDCQLIQISPDLIFSVSHFTTYSVTENSQLAIYTDTEDDRVYTYENITFYANYTNSTNNAAIAIASCTIEFIDGSDIMIYNASSNLFEYSRNFTYSNSFSYNVSCSATGYTTINLTDYFNVNTYGNVITPDSITTINSSRNNLNYTDKTITVESGNTTELSINYTVTTEFWQGYYGNINAEIKLRNADNNSFYEWNNVTPTGEVFATRGINTNFNTIKCALDEEIYDEEQYLGNNNTPESIMNTFNDTNHPQFNVQLATINANSCKSTKTLSADNSDWYELILSDGASNIIYTTLINASNTGFNNNAYDFQLLVAANSIETYYFFVEIG